MMTPQLDGQGGDRDLALATKPERAGRTAWPARAAGRATGGYCERSDRGGGGGGGGGRNAREVSPTLPLEGLHKMEGCFVTPKKVSYTAAVSHHRKGRDNNAELTTGGRLLKTAFVFSLCQVSASVSFWTSTDIRRNLLLSGDRNGF